MSFSVSSNMYLRNCYASYDRSLCTKSNRSEKTSGTLSFADSSALRKAIRNLGDFDYEDDDNNEEFSNQLKAFIDSYNYTLSSSSKSSQTDVKNAAKNLKKVSDKFEKELSNLGISFDSDGYMSISSSAKDNVKVSSYKDVFGSESSYLSEINKYSKRIMSHVDLSL